jgi:hypothetical protein
MPAKRKLKLTEFVPTEHQEQSIVISWADELAQWKRFPELSLLYAIPNGGYALAGDVSRRSAAAAKLRSEGLRAGFPDLCLPVARRGFWALYIEMKSTRKGADVSLEQTQWIESLNKAGNHAVVCYGHKEAQDKLLWYLTYGGDK